MNKVEKPAKILSQSTPRADQEAKLIIRENIDETLNKAVELIG